MLEKISDVIFITIVHTHIVQYFGAIIFVNKKKTEFNKFEVKSVKIILLSAIK